jgi:hypothetical protein
MKRSFGLLLCVVTLAGGAFAAAIGTAANAVIPADVQQIISVDYRTLNNSPTALALKDRVMPDSLKTFEQALRSTGIDPNNDVDNLTFAAFRTEKAGVRLIGIAQGEFARTKILKKMKAQKITGTKYKQAMLYPLHGGMEITFLDDFTMLFGEDLAVKYALDTRDGDHYSMYTNPNLMDMIQSVNAGAVWSVLDDKGTQNMLKSTLGDAAKLADYDTIKKRLLGSMYTMDFNNGVNFDLNVVTADSMTAATLSSLIQAGLMVKKMNASPIEKAAMEGLKVDSDSAKLQLHFKSDDQKFQSLLHSDLFAAITR